MELPSSTGFNVGGSNDLDEHWHLLFAESSGLLNGQQTDGTSLYFAFQVTG